MSNPKTILKLDVSARGKASVSRQLADDLVARLLEADPQARVLTRDLSTGLPFIDEAWIGANFTDPAERTPEQKLKLALSDTLVNELRSADILVIGLPVYNFGVPATLKAWIDLVARARETFRYTENGPVGLLDGRKAYVVFASGGTAIGSDIDFASGYLRHMLGFVGITDVSFIAADQMMMDADAKREAARAAIEDLAGRAA
ncbi:FMN-dependent NADH-azoreductase [Polymorphum gilvum]|uniref:FMN dependent NADH:quinone oxidoreductase n=1 Tax=Polymorphum gilvum (strain LMG 25793 / CGMCC 1.9160 / SL003B-26A1) TaxID=991905 RepID=F2J1F4_POLGS|nr:NAD(P)H-dependent oxidoreductase [Polymorphum gilvum]ADZ69736.1 NADPH-dependent FMN reductase, putative [Polymorphum gilvum SL003B-26A1]